MTQLTKFVIKVDLFAWKGENFVPGLVPLDCSAYYHLSRIAKIRHSLTTSVCKSLIHGLITSRLDYGKLCYLA